MTSKYAEAFSKNLKTLLEENKISQAELSRQTGIPNQTISRYLSCQRKISIDYLCKIADFFNEDIDVLLGRREY